MKKDLANKNDKWLKLITKNSTLLIRLRGIIPIKFGMIICDVKGIIIDVNQTGASCFSWQPDKLRCQSIEVLIPKAKHEFHQKITAAHVKNSSGSNLALGSERVVET